MRRANDFLRRAHIMADTARVIFGYGRHRDFIAAFPSSPLLLREVQSAL